MGEIITPFPSNEGDLGVTHVEIKDITRDIDGEQGLVWKEVIVGLRTDGSEFKINFDHITEKLQEIIKTEITGRTIATSLSESKYSILQGSFILGVRDGVEVVVHMQRAGKRFEFDPKTGWRLDEDMWRIEGPSLSGPLERDLKTEETGFIQPALSFMIRPLSEQKFNRPPVSDPRVKATMIDLADEIAAAFSPQ